MKKKEEEEAEEEEVEKKEKRSVQSKMSSNNNYWYLTITIAIVLCLLSIPLYSLKLSIPHNKQEGQVKKKTVPFACQLAATTAAGGGRKEREEERIVAIGDIHGSYNGLLEDLFYANLTTDRQSCTWRRQSIHTILVQMGDLVDRGPGALPALECLRKLQTEAEGFNAKVIRLLGNHEMWWLSGYFHERHPEADTREVVTRFLRLLSEDLKSGAVQGAYLHHVHDIPIVFVHAGYSPPFLHYLSQQGVKTVEDIVLTTNLTLSSAIQNCGNHLLCDLKGELFDAGPDRGGRNIGGPFWTDFHTLEAAVDRGYTPYFMQVVGHTMAHCYSRARPGVHPPNTRAECSRGLVRGSVDLSVVCVDGGMYLGARAFLEIGVDGRLRAWERRRGEEEGEEDEVSWKVHDLTEQHCGSEPSSSSSSSSSTLSSSL